MKLGDLKEGARFKVVGWENSPELRVRFPVGGRFTLYFRRADGEFCELTTGVLADVDGHSMKENLETTHVFPESTEVERI